MPNVLYRPLDVSISGVKQQQQQQQQQHTHTQQQQQHQQQNGGSGLRAKSSAMRHHWYKGAPTRKIWTFGLLVTLLLVYLMWCAFATTHTELNYAGKSQATEIITNAAATTNSSTNTPWGKPNDSKLPRGIAFITAPILMERLRKYGVTMANNQKNNNNNNKDNVVTKTDNGRTKTTSKLQRLPKSTNFRPVNESLVICSEVFIDTRVYIQNRARREYDNLPIIYFVTPTYPRREQIPELTRLAHTLLHVARVHWILANDHNSCNVFLDYFLNKFGIPFTHLASPMPDNFRKKKPIPRGVANRRAAIQWLRQRNITNGVLYFGDDDNTYDLKLFSEIRSTKRVAMFPVGLIEEYSISGPVVRKGKVVGFLDSWVADRHWPVDMAGFAVNLAYMSEHPNASMPYKPGYEEDYFLRSISLHLVDIEPKGNNCTEVLVWHTQTKNHNRSIVRIGSEFLDDRSNLGALFKSLENMGVAIASDNEGPKAIISKNGKAKAITYFLS